MFLFGLFLSSLPIFFFLFNFWTLFLNTGIWRNGYPNSHITSNVPLEFSLFLLFLYPIQDRLWLPVKADGDLIWDIRICGIQRVGWLFHSPTQVKTCNTKNINEKKKIKTNTGKYRIADENTHISLVGTICNFLTPPPNVIILLLAKVCGLGVEFWVFLFWPYQNLTIASNKKRLRKSLTDIIAFEQGGQAGFTNYILKIQSNS